VSLPEQLLLSDLLRRRVRCDQGLDHGPGVLAWMHPPVHRLLGWISKPSAFGDRREVWRLDQLRGLLELEAMVQGDPAQTDLPTVDRLPSLIEAVLLDRRGEPIGLVADAAVELNTGRIAHYLVSRSDPRLPGSSRWRLSPERISDQQPGQVFTGLSGLDDLPLARASVRQEFLRRGRRWRDQLQEETERLRDQFQQVSGQMEERLEGWLEEDAEELQEPRWQRSEQDAWDDWEDTPAPRSPRQRPSSERDDDPWF
jgi:sporulation protein YlmC with PRC-barrel domain